MTFRNGVIEGFEPKYKSIRKDHDRYLDALVDLSEKGIIQTSEIIQLSGAGSLWISYQYIERGHLDLVEADERRAVTSRDFFGPLFENTRLVLERLLEISEHDRVIAVYQAAIRHRLRAIKTEVTYWQKARKKHPPDAQSKQIARLMPPLKNMIRDYKALLGRIERTDPTVQEFEQALETMEAKRKYAP